MPLLIVLNRFNYNFLVEGIVFALFVSPLLSVIIIDHSYLMTLFVLDFPIVLLCSFSLFFLLIPFWNKPRVFRAVQIPILILTFLFHALMSILPIMFFPWVTLSAAIVMLSIIICWKNKRKVKAIIALDAIWVTYLMIDMVRYHSLQGVIVVIVTVLTILVVLSIALKHSLTSFLNIKLALIVYSLTVYPFGLVNMDINFPLLIDKVKQQPGVSVLFHYPKITSDMAICHQTKTLARIPGTNQALISPHLMCQQFQVIDFENPNRIRTLQINSFASDNVIFDPFDSNIFYSMTTANFLKIRIYPFKAINRIPLNVDNFDPTHIRYDPVSDRIFFSGSWGGEVFIVDRPKFSMVGKMSFSKDYSVHDLWIDSKRRLLFVTGITTKSFRGQLDIYSLDSLEKIKTFNYGQLAFGFHNLTEDNENGHVYIASTRSGKVHVFDIEQMKELEPIHFEPGLRNVNYDQKRNLLLVSSYYQGQLIVYQPRKHRFVGRINLGKRVRWVEIDPENYKWYVTSSVGGFEIDPERAFDHNSLD